jgi:hypothetical protein
MRYVKLMTNMFCLAGAQVCRCEFSGSLLEAVKRTINGRTSSNCLHSAPVQINQATREACCSQIVEFG